MFVPDPVLRLEISKEAEKKLRKEFSEGTYFETDQIVEILNFLHNYHYNETCEIIHGIDSREVISFLLFQFELVEKDNVYKEKSEQEYVFFKETIFYLLDLIVEKKSTESSNIVYFDKYELFHRLWIHAKNAIEYSNVSNLSHWICKGNTALTIYPVGAKYFIEHEILNSFTENFQSFGSDKKRNITLRDKYINGSDLQNEIYEILSSDDNLGFKSEFGLSYVEFEYIILDMIMNCKKINGPNDIPCISDSHIYSLAKGLNISKENIERLLNGVTLDISQFDHRKREVWDFTQQERSRKRPLVQINFDGKDLRLFAPSLLRERILMLGEDILLSPQLRLPKEWKVGIINKKLSQCNTKIGKWFENKTINLLRLIKIIGFKPSIRIKLSNFEVINIKPDIGPPDFIGYSFNDNSLVIIECKLLDCVFESKGIYGELSKFLCKNDSKKCYVQKFKEKIAWISENLNSIKKAISYNCKIVVPENCNSIMYCFVTYYPTMLRYFYSEIPCPTLFELLDSYNINQKWPFEFGKIQF
ncbi:MAG: hypothetical protein JXB49_16360 [Bacteroidales bacterium]|nr:hypothetical protein [Bacteroidales bacterium]